MISDDARVGAIGLRCRVSRAASHYYSVPGRPNATWQSGTVGTGITMPSFASPCPSRLLEHREAKPSPATLLIPAAAVIALVAAQYLFTRAALPRMAYEELAESVRNPYWISQQHMYNRWSSNVGWYGLLAVVYHAIGFDIYLAKWVRLALHAMSLCFLATLLVRWLGMVRGTAVLLAVGLSSSWLYCNTYQTSYGIDLQFVPILLFMLLFSRIDEPRREGGGLWFGLLFCIAALCYPTTIFYLPCCFLLVAYRLWIANQLFRPRKLLWLASLSAAGFYLPIGVALSYLKDPTDLLDGLFQGGGAGMTLQLDVMLAGGRRVIADFFVQPTSYCFDLPYVEFSSWISFVLFLVTVNAAVWYLVTHVGKRSLRDPHFVGLSLSLFVMVWFLIAPNLIPNQPGIRRSTGLLVGYYGVMAFLLALLWKSAYSGTAAGMQPLAAWTLLLLQLTANGVTLGRNLSAYPEMATRQNEAWIMVRGNPRESLEYWFQEAQAGRPFKCPHFGRGCRYAVRLAGVRALQQFNGRDEFPVYGVDPRTEEVKALSISLWERHEWPF